VAGIGWFAGVVALGAIVYQLARALFGIGAELSDVPGWLTTFVLGGLTYWHHRVVLGAARTEKVRILEYIFGGAGLVSSASAIVTLAAIAIDNLTGSAVIDGESGEVVTAAVVALVVSAAVVIRFWGRGLQLSGEPAEVASPARRTVTIVLLFGAAITGVGALIGVLFVLLRAAIAGETSQMSEGLSIGIPIVAVAGVLCWHLVGLRRQATHPAAGEAVAGVVSRGTRTVTIVASDPGPLPQMIEKMRFLKRSDGVGLVDDLQAEEIVAAVDRADGTSLLVTVGGDGFQVVPLA
ncbi:MAG: DUF5671 domain-containing protein, partial [Actinomycetota bacterium]